MANNILKNESLEEEIKRYKEKMREKEHQLQNLIGRPEKMDDLARREEGLHNKQIRIEELEDDVKLLEQKNDEISDELES